MLTQDELASLLENVNVADVARRADIATKTVYRLRHKANPPNLRTIEKIVAAIEEIRSERKKEQRRSKASTVKAA